MELILASQSKYRQSLLKKIGVPFSCQNPLLAEEEVKENLVSQNLTPYEIANELAIQKGLSLFQKMTDQKQKIVISGDQLVQFNNEILGKPLSFENAFLQLKKMNDNTHQLITSIALITDEKIIQHTEVINMKMRMLSDQEISNYLKKDEPFDCAGSYKIEKHGIALFDSIECHDFSAIEGLPLLWLCKQLKEFQYEFFTT